VTRKDGNAKTDIKGILVNLWPWMLYYLLFLGGTLYLIVKASLGKYSSAELVVGLSAVGWGSIIVLYVWPPLETTIPRKETDLGWKISWEAMYDVSKFQIDSRNRLIKAIHRFLSRTSISRQGSLNIHDAVEIGNKSLSNIKASFRPGKYPSEIETDLEISPFDMDNATYSFDVVVETDVQAPGNTVEDTSGATATSDRSHSFISPFEIEEEEKSEESSNQHVSFCVYALNHIFAANLIPAHKR
jgi:hypothetical protein